MNRRLLRIEERLDVRRVELTHDVLTGVVKASRDARHEREAMRVAAQLRAEQPGDATLDIDYASAEEWLTAALGYLGRNEEARRAGADALAVVTAVLARHPQYGEALLTKEVAEFGLTVAARGELAPADAQRFASQDIQASLALVRLEPMNVIYINNLGLGYEHLAGALWEAGRLREAVAYGRQAVDAFGHGAMSGFVLGNAVVATAGVARLQALLGDPAGASATTAAGSALLSQSRLEALGLASSYAQTSFNALRAVPDSTVAYERGDFSAARRIARDAVTRLRAARPSGTEQTAAQNEALCPLSDVEGHAAFQLGEFGQAAQAERVAMQACEALGNGSHIFIFYPRAAAQAATWLSMSLAREGQRQEAAQTVGPVVTMYRALAAKNHGDQWLPLELAEALYAQSLSDTDPAHRAALLRQASGFVDRLIPAIARLHDTREWRARRTVGDPGA